MCGYVIVSLRALRAHSLFARKLKHPPKFWRKSCLIDFCLMEHPAGQDASAATPSASAEKPASSVEKQEEQQDQQLHQIQQQPGKPAANAGQETLALSSAVGTGQVALANVGGSAGKPAQEPQLAIRRDVLSSLLEACTWGHATRAWLTPVTEPDARLCGMDWRNMLKLPPGWTPTSFVPTFFHDEPDSNQRDKPRLDIVVSFGNGHSVRYHPGADPIWSAWPQPTDATQKRYNRAQQINLVVAREKTGEWW